MDKLIIAGMIVSTIFTVINMFIFFKTGETEWIILSCFNMLAVVMLAMCFLM